MRHGFRTITEELYELHQTLLDQWPHLVRIAVALYDEQTGMLHTFVRSNFDQHFLNHYSAPLSEIPSLTEIAANGMPRVIKDLSILRQSRSEHSQVISQNFQSSFTEPFYFNETLLGFIFYDSTLVDYFDEHLEKQLTAYTRLMEALVVSDLLPIKTLVGLVETTKEITRLKDDETNKHLIRMASYMEMIVIELAEKFGFSDEQIEYIWFYAPLHDVGKLAIKDEILMKPGKLTFEEYQIMQTHVNEGLLFLESIEKNFRFQPLHHVEILRDLIGAHHERWDGSGYPLGLKGEAIPIIGRIAAVADVFDAVSSDRVYRKAWTFEQSFSYIIENRGILFDPVCVDALIKNKDKVLKVFDKFQEDG